MCVNNRHTQPTDGGQLTPTRGSMRGCVESHGVDRRERGTSHEVPVRSFFVRCNDRIRGLSGLQIRLVTYSTIPHQTSD